MGQLIKQKKTVCPFCGAQDMWYMLSEDTCLYCKNPVQYDEYCTCISTGTLDCNKCEENPNVTEKSNTM